MVALSATLAVEKAKDPIADIIDKKGELTQKVSDIIISKFYDYFCL